jgi:hypothetical protein
MAQLTTVDVDVLMRKLIPSAVAVLGTFPADKVPSTSLVEQQPSCFVLNTHPEGQPGEHWLAFYYDGRGTLEYFDSYGMPLEVHAHVHRAIASCGLLSMCKRANVEMLQSSVTAACGQYCVLFLYWRAKHMLAPVSQFADWVKLCGSASVAVDRDVFVVRQLGRLVARCTLPPAPAAPRPSVPSSWSSLCRVQTCHCRCI